MQLTYAHRVERLSGEDRLDGYFFGGYASRNDVRSDTAEGAIDGLGLFGGLYGAMQLPRDGMLDWYGAAAAGRHGFALDFARDLTISADGNYVYLALFGGAAVSRSYETESALVIPRLGFDIAWAPGAEVSVTARQGERRESGDFGLGASGTWLLFLETELRGLPDAPLQGEGLFAGYALDLGLTPSALCEGGTETAAECGLGLRGGVFATGEDQSGVWSLELAVERTQRAAEAALELSWERRLDASGSALRLGLAAAPDGAPSAQIGLQLRF